jgi:hypothetical protein
MKKPILKVGFCYFVMRLPCLNYLVLTLFTGEGIVLLLTGSEDGIQRLQASFCLRSKTVQCNPNLESFPMKFIAFAIGMIGIGAIAYKNREPIVAGATKMVSLLKPAATTA